MEFDLIWAKINDIPRIYPKMLPRTVYNPSGLWILSQSLQSDNLGSEARASKTEFSSWGWETSEKLAL